jgi:hypothetical protein
MAAVKRLKAGTPEGGKVQALAVEKDPKILAVMERMNESGFFSVRFQVAQSEEDALAVIRDRKDISVAVVSDEFPGLPEKLKQAALGRSLEVIGVTNGPEDEERVGGLPNRNNRLFMENLLLDVLAASKKKITT